MAEPSTKRPDMVVAGLLHPREIAQFTALCRETEREDLKGLRLRVIAYLASLTRLADDDPRIDIAVARRIGSTIAHVVDDPLELDATDRALLCGAAEYFLMSNDDGADLGPLGFDDDRRILNRVLRAIGRDDLLLD